MFVVSIQSAECKNKKAKGLIRETAYGLVEGYKHSKKTYGWLGIPFAKPPVDDLRWKAPLPPEPWDGVRDATDPDNCTPCTQILTDGMWGTVFDDETGLPAIIGAEDCLYLNIFAQEKAKKWPVYVYIHGGSNRFGMANDYNGARLAEKEKIVFVAVQYRVGPLGWFYHPAAQMNDNDADNSGNYGNLDNIRALEWIQENIEAFGGDPDNVTIAGESAGAHNSTVLLATPLAAGLFHRAHIESSGMTNDGNGVITYTPATGRYFANNMLNVLLGDTSGMTDEEIAAAAAEKSGAEIIHAMYFSGSPLYDAIVDGYVLPKDYFELFNEGDYNQVPVIIGTNEYEVKPFMRFFVSPLVAPWNALFNDVLVNETRTMDEVFEDFYGDQADEGKRLYEIAGYWGSQNWRAKHLDELASMLAAQQDDVYGYFFKWGGIGSGPESFDFIVGAGHAFEIPFWQGADDSLFGLSFIKENEKGRKDTQKAMMKYLAEFAENGDPNKKGKKGKKGKLIEWEPWSNEDGGPKALEIDADKKKVILNMSSETVTFADVAQGLAADTATLPEEMQGLTGLFQWYIPYVPPEDR
jgi:para-nitrobenzyl esterase